MSTFFHEAGDYGKGANTVVSQLHYDFESTMAWARRRCFTVWGNLLYGMFKNFFMSYRN